MSEPCRDADHPSSLDSIRQYMSDLRRDVFIVASQELVRCMFKVLSRSSGRKPEVMHSEVRFDKASDYLIGSVGSAALC